MHPATFPPHTPKYQPRKQATNHTRVSHLQACRHNCKSHATWCARQMRSSPCFSQNCRMMSSPKIYDTPRSFTPHDEVRASGSAHNRSHSIPVCDHANTRRDQRAKPTPHTHAYAPKSGMSHGLRILLIFSNLSNSGDSPPCMQKMRSDTTAALWRERKTRHDAMAVRKSVLNTRLDGPCTGPHTQASTHANQPAYS